MEDKWGSLVFFKANHVAVLLLESCRSVETYYKAVWGDLAVGLTRVAEKFMKSNQ